MAARRLLVRLPSARLPGPAAPDPRDVYLSSRPLPQEAESQPSGFYHREVSFSFPLLSLYFVAAIYKLKPEFLSLFSSRFPEIVMEGQRGRDAPGEEEGERRHAADYRII